MLFILYIRMALLRGFRAIRRSLINRSREQFDQAVSDVLYLTMPIASGLKNEEQKKQKDIGAARNRTGAGAATTRRHTTRPQHLLDIRLGPFFYYNHI